MLQAALCCVLAASLGAEDPAGPALGIRISDETAPAGGWVQIKAFLTTPQVVAQGSIAMDFDPAVFGDVAQVAVFSAAGDAMGSANVKGRHVDAQFSSPSGGIGQLPEMPAFAVRIPVLGSAAAGTVATVTLDASGADWMDRQGNTYAVTVMPGKLTIGGSLAVESVTPGGGLLPTGAVVEIRGTGFEAGTTVAMDGVSISTVQVASPQLIRATLDGATEITGKHVRVSNAGARVDHFVAPPSGPSNTLAPIEGVHTMLPLATYKSITAENSIGDAFDARGVALLNQTAAPVSVALQGVNFGATPVYGGAVTIPGGALYLVNLDALAGPEFWITATAPIRMMNYRYFGRPPSPHGGVSIPTPATSGPRPITVPVNPGTVSWSWQKGASPPVPATLTVSGNLGFTVLVSSPGGAWLRATPMQGTAPATVTVSADPSALNPGSYEGTVMITPVAPASLPGFPVETTTVRVSITVTADPMVIAGGPCCAFLEPVVGGPVPFPVNLMVTSNGAPVNFTVTFSTSSGGNWLAVTPLRGTTPANLTVSANPVGLGLRGGEYTGEIRIQGPGNTVTVPATLIVYEAPTLPSGTTLQPSISSVSTALQAGDSPRGSLTSIHFQVGVRSIAATVDTQSGGSWLSVSLIQGVGASDGVLVYVSAATLQPGTYQGTITITSPTLGSAQVPVTLTVVAVPTAETPLTVTPASLSLSAPAGEFVQSEPVRVESGGVPVLLSVGAFTADGARWMESFDIQAAFTSADSRPTTPATVKVGAVALQPGAYYGGVTFQAPPNSVKVPVTFSVTASAAFPPVMGAVTNGASQTAAGIAPGEIITIFGTGIGSAPTGLQLDAAGKVATKLNDTQVLINGVAAPLIYVSAGQVNAIVPYEAGTSGPATIEVMSNGVKGVAWGVPLAAAAPAIFTLGTTGRGQAAVLNQDNTVNGAERRARRGSVIQIFATGEGQTSPLGVTGSITQSNVKIPVLPVTVKIGGMEAQVQYAGSAPQEVAGLFQVNAVVPEEVTPDLAVPISIAVGDRRSPEGVTVAIE